MARHCETRLDGIQAKGLRARFASIEERGEQSANGVGDQKRAAGAIVARALECVGMTPKSAAGRMGYSESSSISDFVSGLTVPAFIARFIADPVLRSGFIEALAELPDDGVVIERVVRIQRKERIA